MDNYILHRKWVIFKKYNLELQDGWILMFQIILWPQVQKYYITLTYPPGGEYGWCAGNGDPYVSGESSGPVDEDFCFRTWANKGKSKNSINIEGEWSNPLFQWFLENHPHLFPLLRQILGL